MHASVLDNGSMNAHDRGEGRVVLLVHADVVGAVPCMVVCLPQRRPLALSVVCVAIMISRQGICVSKQQLLLEVCLCSRSRVSLPSMVLGHLCTPGHWG